MASLHKPSKPLVMGVLNVTPDSFSDGGCYLKTDAALQHARKLIEEGVDLIDVGGESTKPGAEAVGLEEELERVIPVIENLRTLSDVCISIDTSKPQVMRAAVQAGASLINDVNAFQEEGALELAAKLNVPICIMHKQGTPRAMQSAPHYPDGLIETINHFFTERITAALAAGIPRSHLIIDPGFGFGKTVAHNLNLLGSLTCFRQHGLPILLGVSRKSTIGALLNKPITERLMGGLAIAVYAMMQGVSLIRTHDVGATNDALRMIEAILNEKERADEPT